jgi:uroporphyrinogen-III synthase
MSESAGPAVEVAGALSGLGVLVTRPAHQAEKLCRLIAEAGGHPIAFPTLEILPAEDLDAARALLAESWDLMIFTSRNAVEFALALGFDGGWSQAVRLAAVGKATGQVLAQSGRAPDLVPPERYDSESLVAMPELAEMDGKRVLIVRGEGGRALLGETLGERGAQVRFAEVYRRVRPDSDPRPLLADWPGQVGLAMATSDEILQSLVEIVGPDGREPLLATPLVVIAERTAATARGIGFATVRVAERAEDAAILRALCELAAPSSAT